MLGWRSAQETWCDALVCRCVCFCFSVCLLVLLEKIYSCTQIQGSNEWQTEVNHGLSFPVILKEIPPSSQIFAGIYGTQSQDDLFHHSKWEQSSRSRIKSSNGKWSVFYCLKNNNGDHLILCLTLLAKLKRICTQFARKCIPEFPTLD